jgi:diacylglycerol kinase (ATP)
MESPFKSKNGLERIAKALGYSLAGLKAAYAHEAAIRQETWLMVVFLPLAFYVGHSNVERILLIGATLLVYIVELLNSSIETAVDHTSLDAHPMAGRAKDIGSAAVFVALINFALTWGMLFVSRFFI